MRFHQTLLFLALLCPSKEHQLLKRDASQAEQKRVVCYYTNWSVYRPGTAKFNPQNINPYLCTHLIYAFGGLDRENGLRPYDKYQDLEQGGYAKFTGLKTYNKALKTMLAIGGWNEGSARFSPLVADEDRRREFVKNVVKFLRVNHFDGLDLDWEYPAFRDGGKTHDKENYAQLVQELREEFERESSKTGRVRLLLTMAVPAGIEYIDKGYDIPKLNKYLDFMNILSYDYHSAFEPSVNHHSPLYSLEEESEYNYDSQLTIDATVKHYLMKGADANKLVLGIPTYGRSYTLFNEASTDLGAPADGPGDQGDATREKGYLAYYEICSKVKDGWTVVHPKNTAMGPYAYKGNQWVGYDDENIVRRKSQYVNEKHLGGIMIWSIDNDDFRGNCHQRAYPLIEAAKEAMLGKAATKQVPSAVRSSKTSSSKSSKLKNQRSSTTTTSPPVSSTVTTPEPPTTPDPGSDFVCKDEGFFPHPRDCKKYFWCLDSGPSNLGIVAHQFTCPSGLFFNKAADSCDFARNVICKKKSTTTTSTTSTTTPRTTTRATTTLRSSLSRVASTTTPFPPPLQDYEDDSEEDPQTIKQLIHLIKKLGGVDELEKQLEGTTGSDVTTPSISKSLFERVINKGNPKYQILHRNGPSGPQNEGLTRETVRAPYRRDKPQYVTIRRERPSTTTEGLNLAEYADVDDVVEPDDRDLEEIPKYKGLHYSSRESDAAENSDPPAKSERHFRPKYQSAEQFRPKHPSTEDQEASTKKYSSLVRSRPSTFRDHTSSTSKYVTLQRQKPQQPQELGTTKNYVLEEEGESEEQLADLETTTTSTSRPRVKIGRVRRPVNSRLISKGSTSTSTASPPVLTQRLNKFKVDKTLPKSSIISATEGNRTLYPTLRPRKTEFRRVIRPGISSQNVAEDSQLGESYSRSVSKDTSVGSEKAKFPRDPNSFILSEESEKDRYTDEVSEDQVTDAEIYGQLEEQVSGDSKEQSSRLPDLANVAVAAIQSLATSAPSTQSTEKYKSTPHAAVGKSVLSGTVRPSSRPSRPFRPTTRAGVTRVRTSSPRPFSKPTAQPTTPARGATSPHRTSLIYEDYDADYYVEPVDLPLSGKVRIHADGYIECLDIGNFPHPFSCRKFISCAKMENGRLLGWEYTCPKGLSFDPIGGICNWNAGLGCKE
ncbi:chitinase 6 isoform X2 [Rhodnius prolixus]|uniref:chitinase 6 isoform X2 n=1 Tax=Rhodnius prolixus TaxID=13249 RepID=UPI003D18DB16